MHVIVSDKWHIGLYVLATNIVESVFKDYCIVHSDLGGFYVKKNSMSRHFLYPHTKDIAKVSQKT